MADEFSDIMPVGHKTRREGLEQGRIARRIPGRAWSCPELPGGDCLVQTRVWFWPHVCLCAVLLFLCAYPRVCVVFVGSVVIVVVRRWFLTVC